MSRLGQHIGFCKSRDGAQIAMGRAMPTPIFRTPYYKFVRRPIYFGLVITFWAAATPWRKSV